jgi:hypothetical protein
MRDRLAADLHEIGAYRDLDDDVNRAEYADRLIALGWVRLDEDELMQAKHDYAAKMLAIAREGGVLVTEERLAWALAMTEVGCWANPPHHSAAQDDEVHRRDAAALIRALREEP